jgi:hypothetical protein
LTCEQVLYDDSVHCELPVAAVAQLVAQRGVEHIMLAPGDAVVWHDSIWHYSPPNLSDEGRIGIAGVFTTPENVERTAKSGRGWKADNTWVMKDGVPCKDFPPDFYVRSDTTAPGDVPPHPHLGSRPSTDARL